MSFPTLYREIARMIEDTATTTSVARAIFRKAGLRQSESDGDGTGVDLSGARTLVNAYIDPAFNASNYQWEVDLTGFTHLRFVSRGPFMWVWYSLAGVGSSVLDPGDYQKFPSGVFVDPENEYDLQFIEAYSGNSEMYLGKGRSLILPELRGPMRLSFGFSYDFWPGPDAGGF